MIRQIIAATACVVAANAAVAPAPLAAAAPPAAIDGQWKTADGRAVVTIARCGSAYCGRISRFLVAEPAGGAKDTENPNRNLRGRSLMGLRILWDLKADGGDWQGKGYSPPDGRYFTAKVRKLSADRLEVKGCVAVFCKTQVWPRYN